MKKIELDHWFIKDSKLSISLMNLYVEIKILVKYNKKTTKTIIPIYNSIPT